MKKIIPISVVIILLFSSATYALNSSFNIDTVSISVETNSKTDDVTSNFSDEYALMSELSTTSANEDEIKNITKKTAILLLGNPGTESESAEDYYKRHQEYRDLALYNVFPKDENNVLGYDESNPYYAYAVASTMAIPQIFNQVNEVLVSYDTLGSIKITEKDDLAISTITLPNVKVKEENADNPMEYDVVDTNLLMTYFFVKMEGEYRLAYLYGETKEEIEEYTDEVDGLENSNNLSIIPAYDSNLKDIYNYDKLNAISDTQIENIATQNQDNLVKVSAYYSNAEVTSANGFFISDGIILTTWSFLEEALVEGQFIMVSNTSEAYDIDGIITVNPDTDVALIKLKNKTGNSVTLKSKDEVVVEDPIISLVSKTGVGVTAQKGIVTAVDDYVQSDIPFTSADQGGILIDANTGTVIGMNVNKFGTSSMSYAIGSDILNEIKQKFDGMNFEEIQVTTFDQLKESYYYTKYNDEVVSNSIPDNKWKKYSQIGKIEENIKLNLVKASYKDKIVSLRYENNASELISSIQYSAKFQKELLNEGYTLTVDTDEKCILENNKYKVIIMEEFDYLIVIMAEK